MFRRMFILAAMLTMAGCTANQPKVVEDKKYFGDEVHVFRDYYDHDGRLLKREAYVDDKLVATWNEP